MHGMACAGARRRAGGRIGTRRRFTAPATSGRHKCIGCDFPIFHTSLHESPVPVRPPSACYNYRQPHMRGLRSLLPSFHVRPAQRDASDIAHRVVGVAQQWHGQRFSRALARGPHLDTIALGSNLAWRSPCRQATEYASPSQARVTEGVE